MQDAMKTPKNPESYSPKLPFILDLAGGHAYPSDTIADPFRGGEPPRTSNKILNYRRIQNWENYFLDSAICSVAKALGMDEEKYDKHFFSAITGDMFAYLYNSKKPCDSGITNYFFVPQVVKKTYAAMGYECFYISNRQIKKDFRIVMNAIKESVDKGIPVLAWGMGNVTMGDGSRYDPLPEGSLIGGYDEGDVLYVNLYPGPERMTVDDDGYTAITNGLDTTNGLFFAGEKCEKTSLEDIYSEALSSIPVFLTLPPSDGYTFGKQAFDTWADTLSDDSYFENMSDDELGGICWDLHCSPYCSVCTTNSYGFIKDAVEQYPGLELAGHLLSLYEKLQMLKDEIWALHGGFFPPMDKFRTAQFRLQIAALLRRMGETCDEILKVYKH